ncbi:MAG: hypothetical protein JO247_21510, partial [Chloroflexi bacterium]|nr:hypothetical protein [Chloroflexota bacterium]
MKPEAAALRQLVLDVDERLVVEHLNRLPDAYFDAFPPEKIAEHLTALAGLSAVKPVAVLVDAQSVTVLAFDHASAFSLICGVLASLGFVIASGEVFTYAPPAPLARGGARRDALGRLVLDPYRRRRIVDRFAGGPIAGVRSEELTARIEEVMSLLEASQPAEARKRVNEWVAEQLLRADPSAGRLFPVKVDASTPPGAAFTRLEVASQDTPAFLYAFSTGLSLHRVSIERVRIATLDQTVHDELDVTGPEGGPITDPRMLELLRVSA